MNATPRAPNQQLHCCTLLQCSSFTKVILKHSTICPSKCQICKLQKFELDILSSHLFREPDIIAKTQRSKLEPHLDQERGPIFLIQDTYRCFVQIGHCFGHLKGVTPTIDQFPQIKHKLRHH